MAFCLVKLAVGAGWFKHVALDLLEEAQVAGYTSVS